MEFTSYIFFPGTVFDDWQLNPCKFPFAAFFQWEVRLECDFQELNVMFKVGNRRSDHDGMFKNPASY